MVDVPTEPNKSIAPTVPRARPHLKRFIVRPRPPRMTDDSADDSDVTVLTDDELRARLTPGDAVAAMEGALRDHGTGDLDAPPREYVPVPGGDLVFTAGGSPDAFGFRAYQTVGRAAGAQVTCVFEPSGALRGVVTGDAVGLLRTAGIGGVAVDHLARADATTLGVLGSKHHAQEQTAAVAAVRDLDRVQVYSPDPDHRDGFVERTADRVDATVEARDEPEPVVRDADVLVCATDSADPVFEADWLADGTHVSTLGPKRAGASEVPAAVADRAALAVTDSAAQAATTEDYLVAHDRLVELGAVVAGEEVGRTDDGEVTLFCSVGLAGTEVALARAAIGG